MTLLPITSVAGAAPPTSVAPARPRLRLDFLDGIRGLTALYVAVYHIAEVLGQLYGNVRGPLHLLAKLFHAGYDVVGIFIVLSGYCLMLPAARERAGLTLPDGAARYFERRAWRILPPYYAALAVSLALNYAAYRAKLHTAAHPFPLAHYGFAAPNLLSHLFLVHNFWAAYIDSIDPPMWSIGIECQIYLLLPLVFLPLVRRFGLWSMVAAGVVIGIAPHLLLPRGHNLDWSCPWFVTLFTFGCAAAILSISDEQYSRWRKSAFSAVFLVLAALLVVGLRFPSDAVMCRHLFVGVTAAMTILMLARHAIDHDAHGFLAPLLRLLESRPAMTLGAFSYSLYLIHVPIEAKLVYIVAQHFSEAATTALAYLIALPLSIAGAYVFYLLVERPTIKYRAKLHSVGQRRVEEVRATHPA